MGQNHNFLKKSGPQTAFLRDTNLNPLTLGVSETHNFECIANSMCFEKFGTLSSKWAIWARRQSLIVSNPNPGYFDFFHWVKHQKNAKKGLSFVFYGEVIWAMLKRNVHSSERSSLSLLWQLVSFFWIVQGTGCWKLGILGRLPVSDITIRGALAEPPP